MMTFIILVVLVALLLTGMPIFAGLALTSLAITLASICRKTTFISTAQRSRSQGHL